MTKTLLTTCSSLLTLILLIALMGVAGCGDPETPSTQTIVEDEDAGDDADADDDDECGASEQCEEEGSICDQGSCRDCQDDDECAEDYGEGNTCQGGRCAPCGGALGCACENGDDCQDGLECAEGVCAEPAPCVEGSEGCPCFGNGTCLDDLVCTDEVCVACPGGTLDCPCGEGQACDEGLVCAEDRCVEEPCVPGTEACACGPDDSCQEGLACVEDVCVSQECVAGSLSCPCFEDQSCDSLLVCQEGVCVECTPGTQSCRCGEEQQCGEGLECVDELCVPENCEDGTLDCPCGPDEACGEELTCDEGLCVECTSRIVGCPCDPPDGDSEQPTCQSDLVCDQEEETCREARLCVDLACAPNQLCEEAGGVDAVCLQACEEGFVFDPETMTCVEEQPAPPNCDEGAPGSILETCQALNRACVVDGETAQCGDCLEFFIEDAEACRAVIQCGDLNCAEINRQCAPHDAQTDAQCAECLMGFEEIDEQCVEEPGANCELDDPNSILEDCELLGRECVASDDSAVCGGCLEGLRPQDPLDPQSQCVDIVTCQDRAEDDQLACDVNEFCVDQEDADSVCSGWPCLDINNEPDLTQALNQAQNQCVDCGIQCDREGEIGLWPFTVTNSDRCICKTEEGFFFDTSDDLTAKSCDKDGDGWVNAAARPLIEDDAKPNLQINARCTVRNVEAFRLQNEWGQTKDILVCEEGLKDGDVETCETPSAVALFEPEISDNQNLMPDNFPTLGEDNGRGRVLRASEVNPLTRACINETLDMNFNLVSDVDEWQGLAPEGASADVVLLMNFSHFIELHRAWYAPHDVNDLSRGVYNIQERSRCDPGFPIQYDPELDRDYWQQCNRFRDGDYDALADDQIGMDFGRWSCADQTGQCPLDPAIDTSNELEAPPRGLCQVNLADDEPWRGMNHHSQFKCVVIDNTLEEREGQGQRDETSLGNVALLSELHDGQGPNTDELQFNRCFVACPENDIDCSLDCDGAVCAESSEPPFLLEANPRATKIACEPVSAADGGVTADDVGFVAVRYKAPYSLDGDGNVERGCIDESLLGPWKDLCPGRIENPSGVKALDNTNNFGELGCGCDFNFGGVGCTTGCPTELVHYGNVPLEEILCANDAECPEGLICLDGACIRDGICDNESGYCPLDVQSKTRKGFWMCGEFTRTAYTVPDGGNQALGGEANCGPDQDQPCFNMKAQSGDHLNTRNLMDTPGCQDEDPSTPCFSLH